MMFVAAVSFPKWEPRPDIWVVIALIVICYLIAVVHLGPRLSPAGQPVVSRFQMVSFGLGVVAVWVAADYPIDVIAEESLYSVHVVQHLLFTLVAAPLLVLGTPGWLLRWILTPRWLFATVRFLARFLPAVILYNVVLVLAHWPAVVDITIENELAHFISHAVLLVSALVVWLPVLSPLPEIPRLAPIGRMVFLFLESLVPTIPASFLTFGSTPLYRRYEDLPLIWGGTTLQDQRIAGLIMKLGAGLVIWAVITVVFFRWAADEEHADRTDSPPGWQDLGQQLTATSSRSL